VPFYSQDLFTFSVLITYLNQVVILCECGLNLKICDIKQFQWNIKNFCCLMVEIF